MADERIRKQVAGLLDFLFRVCSLHRTKHVNTKTAVPMPWTESDMVLALSMVAFVTACDFSRSQGPIVIGFIHDFTTRQIQISGLIPDFGRGRF